MPSPSRLAWATAALAGVLTPALGLALLGGAGGVLPVAAPILAVALMGTGMITAAASGRFAIGLSLALSAGAGLVLLALALGFPALPRPFATAFAVTIASASFAARGALFARSAAPRGWWVAVFVVAGEAAMLGTAAAMPGALPAWLLVLLPAQWASTAIGAALAGTLPSVALASLLALAATAATTLLVARLLPRRWPYLLMFTAWLGFSALVWQQLPEPV